MAAPVLMMPALNVFPAKKGADKGGFHCSAENQLRCFSFHSEGRQYCKKYGRAAKKLMRLPDTP